MSESVQINECFARDGIQHEQAFIPTAEKVSLLEGFVAAGFRRIEATSYSSPKWVPAFSDASELLRDLPRRPDVSFKATCPNPKAVERALADAQAGFGAEEVSLLSSASESHTQTNLRCTREEQWARLTEMAALGRGTFRLVGVISVAFGCPFEGAIDPGIVSEDTARFRELGADVITIGDTTGLADPGAVRRLFARLVQEHPGFPIVGHFHDTRGSGVANAVAAYDVGCTRLDTAMGGVGGHPAKIEYGGGRTGNVATEDIVNLFESMGISTGLDLDQVMVMSERCERALGRQLESKVGRAGWSSLIPTGSVVA